MVVQTHVMKGAGYRTVFAAGDERLCLQHMTGLRKNSHLAEKAALNVCEWRYICSYLTPLKHRRGTREIDQALAHCEAVDRTRR